MRLTGRSFFMMLALLVLTVGAIPLSTLQAQNSTVTISVAVPTFNKDAFTDKLISDFESANPGIKLNIVANDASIPAAASGLSSHFDELGKYAAAADVLYVDSSKMSVEATRAGYFLDLAPLVNEDKTLQPDGFFPSIWQSYQWNRGIWALPVAANVYLMSYKPSAFDKVGLAYPSDQWTIDDIVTAVNKLAEKDSSGKVTAPGIDMFSNFSTATLFRSLLSEGLYDSSTLPNTPKLDTPAAEALVDAWAALDKDGYIGSELNTAPLSVSPATTVLFQTDPEQKRVPLLLPGGRAGMEVQGFAVSAGTQYPDKAYAVAAFLTTRTEISNRFTSAPARKSLVGTDNNSAGFRLNVTPEFQALIDQAIEKAIPVSEMRHTDYLALALNKIKLTGSDAKTELQTEEAQAIADEQTAATKKDSNTLVVATPVPVLDTSSGKITLKFGLTFFGRPPVPNKEKWDKLAADFAASDPQVGKVDIETGFNQLSGAADKYDCFYLPFNAVTDADLSKIINLDPFTDNDPSFDKNDIVGNILNQIQRDNKIWAMPIEIEPAILKYDSDKFQKAAVPAPAGNWTIDAFKDAVKSLKIDPKDTPPFVPAGRGGVYMLLLISAYGGMPLDYRTNPPTINFTDPATVAATRQALDLAKNGYVKYDALSSLAFGFGQSNKDGIVYSDILNAFTSRPNPTDTTTSTYKPVTYPRGSQFAAVSYGIGTAYISAKTQNRDACYRWISTLA
ncbi:MAG: hypothetical protein ABI947_13635, partial [Chloroflexota bacterium]